MSRFSSEAEWRAWQKARVLELQRQRRKQMLRIDYYPTDEAARIVAALSRAGVRLVSDGPYRMTRRDNSSVISYVIETWGANNSGIE
jgi:hypothetical protein